MDIRDLDIAQKIGQVIMPRIDFNDPESIPRARRLVQESQVGGFIIFNGMRDIVARTTDELQSLSKIPLLFGCDAERGVGQIVRDMTLFPFTMSLGAIQDQELLYEQASFIAQEMKECGLNLLFAPVCDVNTNPNNPIINIRSYGDDPELVSKMCSAFIKGCQENGVLACAKHFPGHGRTGVDSHIDLPVLDIEIDSLKNLDLIPFEKSIEAGVASIMTAHIGFPKIGDGDAVTVSKKLLTDVLRDEMGFEGLIITDSLHMEGIIKLGDEDHIASKALGAGCDVILDPRGPSELVENLKNMTISELDQKVERILNIKENLSTKRSSRSLTKEDGLRLKDRIARESVCVVKGGQLKSDSALVYIFDVTESEMEIAKVLTDRLEKNGNSVHIAEDRSLDQITDDASVICLLYTTIGAWKKQSILPEIFKADLKKLEALKSDTTIISFGSPYVIEGFDKFDNIICSFDLLDECQQAVADVLLGKLSTNARIPVRLS